MGDHLGSIHFVFFQWQKYQTNLPNFTNQLCQFGKLLYVMVRRLPNSFLCKCLEWFRHFCMVFWFVNVFIHLQVGDFIHKNKIYIFDSFRSLLTTTYSFGNLAIRSLRKTRILWTQFLLCVFIAIVYVMELLHAHTHNIKIPLHTHLPLIIQN